jgi:phosphoglycolate phosphatase
MCRLPLMFKQIMIRAIVFDFDGTLTELTLDFTSMRNKLKELVLNYVSPKIMREFDDLFMLELIYAVENKLEQRGSVFRNQAFTLLRDIEVEAADGKEVYPYTRDVLRSLREMGMKLGVMTRNCEGAVRKVFPDIDQYVDAIVAREDVLVVKPDPSHPRAVLDRMGVRPSNAILVGDHPTDIAAGRAVGALTAGVLSGRVAKATLEEAGADYVVNDIRGLFAVVREMSGVSKEGPQR